MDGKFTLLSFGVKRLTEVLALKQALHIPIINIPGFRGENGLPVGISVVAPRYHDRKLLAASSSIAKIFEEEGGWKSAL